MSGHSARLSSNIYDITFVLPGLGINGGVRTLLEWARRAAEEGRRVCVVSHAPGPAADWLRGQCDVIYPTAATWKCSSAAGYLLKRSGRVDSYFDLLASTVKGLVPPSMVTVVGWAYWMSSLAGPSRTLSYAQHFEPLLFQSSRWRVMADRKFDLHPPDIVNSSWLRKKFPNGRPAVVYPGVDSATFQPGLGLPKRRDGRFVIAALGRSEPWKGLSNLVDALAIAGFKHELLTFGDDTRRRLSESHRRLGRLTGRQLNNLYQAADAVVTPSWHESFPLPPLEAMASGTPVITTSVGTEDFAINGENALVVPPRDAPALARALNHLLTHPGVRADLAAAGPETARRFTWERGYEMFSEAIEKHP